MYSFRNIPVSPPRVTPALSRPLRNFRRGSSAEYKKVPDLMLTSPFTTWLLEHGPEDQLYLCQPRGSHLSTTMGAVSDVLRLTSNLDSSTGPAVRFY
jgi:hypothetical protein